jgi:DNA-damage-inducible protein J
MLTEKVQARIDPALKKSAEKVFEKLGMTTTEAVRLFFKQVELYQGLPFSVNTPNKATIKAIRDVDENHNLSRYKGFDDLLSEINA